MKDYDLLGKNSANHVPLSPLSLIKRTAALHPDRTAVIHGRRRYTWAEVFSRCRRLCSALGGLGIGRGDTVAVMALNTPEMIECHYGVAAAGGVLNSINVRLDPDTIAYILGHGGASVLVADTAFAETVAAALKILGPDHGITVIDIADSEADGDHALTGKMDYEALLETGDPDCPWELPGDEWDALALNYTSGTSGRPKGVVYHHRGIVMMAMGTIVDWHMPRHVRYLYVVPLFHCNGWCHVYAVTILAGTIVCSRAVTPKAVYDAIADHGVTHFGGAPIVLGMIVNADEADRRPFEHVVEVMTAGAPPPAAVLEGIENLGFNVTQTYGLTETYGHTVISVWQDQWDEVDFSTRATLKARQGVGFSITEDAIVVDQETGESVPRDGETIGQFMDVLRLIFGSAIPEPTDAQITRWASDAYSYGTYSFPAVGMKDDSRARLGSASDGTLDRAWCADVRTTCRRRSVVALICGCRARQFMPRRRVPPTLRRGGGGRQHPDRRLAD